MKDDRDLLTSLGDPNEPALPTESGICSVAWMKQNRILWGTPSQLKNISKMLSSKGQNLTKEEIDRIVFSEGGDTSSELNVDENQKKIAELQTSQRMALAEKQRAYKKWEEEQMKKIQK